MTQDEDKSTPRPWRITGGPGGYGYLIKTVYPPGSESHYWAHVHVHGAGRFTGDRAAYEEEVKANATLIVSAVNSHDAMKECVEAARNFVAKYRDIYRSQPPSFYTGSVTGRAFMQMEEAIAKLEKAT